MAKKEINLILFFIFIFSSCSSSLLSRLPKEKLSLHTTLLTPDVWIFHTKQFPVLCGRQVLLLLSRFSHVRLCATP